MLQQLLAHTSLGFCLNSIQALCSFLPFRCSIICAVPFPQRPWLWSASNWTRALSPCPLNVQKKHQFSLPARGMRARTLRYRLANNQEMLWPKSLNLVPPRRRRVSFSYRQDTSSCCAYTTRFLGLLAIDADSTEYKSPNCRQWLIPPRSFPFYFSLGERAYLSPDLKS